MRVAGMILGTVGGVAAGALGLSWLSDAAKYQAQLELAHNLGIDVGSVVAAGYLLVAALVLGVVGGVLAWRGCGKPAAALLLVAGLAPGMFEPKAFAFTCVLILAGLVSYGATPKPLVPGAVRI